MNKLENNQYSFLELLGKAGIKIPIIQRDYAQGRESAKTIREKFITNLYDVLTTEKKINLDFVYGTIKDGYLIPLDGQQRLTTLFLLHYYLVDDKELLKKFTYETRVSSREFCRLLIEKDIDKKTGKISQTIKNQTWFFSEWENDPTISAMLNTLDTIQNIFGDTKISHKNLENITFSFLNLDDFQLTDELYIKMNARGKPLSQFENFKSHFIECIDNTYIENKEYIKAKLDNEWLDIFWNLEKDNLSNNLAEDKRKEILKSIDDKYLNFFKNITLFFDRDKKPDEIDIFKFDYSREKIETIETILDMISQSQQTEAQTIEKLRSQDENYNINIFEDFIKEKLSFSDRARFYALMQFYIKQGNPFNNEALFTSYMRVNLNIIHNVAVDYDNFRNLVQVIDIVASCLDESSSKFYEKIISIEKISHFKNAFEEEQKKARLICQDLKWEEVFIDAENHWYLDGQIGFLIDYTTNENNQCILGDFIKYFDKFNKIFNSKLLFIEKKKNNIEYQTLIHRALLTYGDYLPEHKKSKKYTFCSFGKSLQEKNENWREVFKLEKNIFFKNLLDEVKMIDNIEVKLKQIIDNYTFNCNDFKSYFINPKKEWTPISDAHYYQILYKNKDKIYLNDGWSSSGARGWGWSRTKELYSFYFYKKYLENSNFTYFNHSWYYTDSKLSCAVLENKENNFAIDIFYKGDAESFKIKFFDRKKKTISEEIRRLLSDNNFLLSDKDSFYWYKHKIPLCEIEEVNAILQDFTKKFENVISPNQT
jgi:hypothetical protein